MKIFKILIVSILCASPVLAQESAPLVPQAGSATAPAPASPLGGSGDREVDKPLQVTGQSRNLSMLMVLKGDKDGINFLNVRKDYKDQVPSTPY